MEKIGKAKFCYEKASSNYSYSWLFGRELPALREFCASTGQEMIETDAFSFDSGILDKTKHSVKLYFIVSSGDVIIKLEMASPTLHGNFTHSQIDLKTLNVQYEHNQYFQSYQGIYKVATAEQLGKYFSPSQLEGQNKELVLKWLYYNIQQNNQHSHMTYSGLKFTFTFEHSYLRNAAVETKTESNTNNKTGIILPVQTTLDTVSLFRNDKFADFVITCGDSTFKTHKIVLASRSPVFASMFEQPLTENIEGKMEIMDAEPKCVEEFLRFVYTGKADMDNCASELFILADKYCVDNLKNLCENHLLNTVNIQSALYLYQLAKLINSQQLSTKCLQTMKQNKSRLLKNAAEAKSFFQEHPELAYQILLT